MHLHPTSGHVEVAARPHATKPAEKFAPSTPGHVVVAAARLHAINQQNQQGFMHLHPSPSSGHVVVAARLHATKPAEKFAPSTLAELASSSTRPRSRLLTFTSNMKK